VTLFLLIAWFLRHGVLQSFPIWLMGTVLCIVPRLRVGSHQRILAASLYVPVFFCFAKARILSPLLSDYMLAIATFLFLWTLLSATEISKASFYEKISRELARFSYTLYVVHMPFLLLLTAWVAGNARWIPNLFHSMAGIGILALAIVYAYGIATITEFRTDALRRRVEASWT
jgi:peptidoglycan/LPS O-acetylase OafA/YrhL